MYNKIIVCTFLTLICTTIISYVHFKSYCTISFLIVRLDGITDSCPTLFGHHSTSQTRYRNTEHRKASSNRGVMTLVLDTFAGCATACVSPFRNKKQYTGIDTPSNAFDLVC